MFFRKKGPSVQWIIVFLGNPGQKYAETRHNVGFMTADEVEREKGVKINRLRFRALTASCEMGGEGALLMKPQTFMNLSGESVSEAAGFYKLPSERVLCISDDVSLPAGKLRIRGSGSAGGHNGLKSIISCLGSDNFPRIKIGIGAPPHPEYEMVDWVTGRFDKPDRALINEAVEKAARAAECIISRGIQEAMNRYN